MQQLRADMSPSIRRIIDPMHANMNAYGIPEPRADAPAVTPALVLVPLLAFDASGHRLGYGGGFFDRTLAAFARPPRIVGVGYARQAIRTIYPQAHDVPMTMIVTEM